MGIAEALADVPDGATVLIGGFGGAGRGGRSRRIRPFLRPPGTP